MKIEKRTDMICVRFVDVGNLDCMQKHKDIIETNGQVWFGKIGVKPSSNKVEDMIKDSCGYIILKKPNTEYICEFDKYCLNEPLDGTFPEYYKDKNLLGHREFSMWFRLLSIKKVEDKSIFDKVVVKSSLESFLTVTGKSMSSFFYLINKEELNL